MNAITASQSEDSPKIRGSAVLPTKRNRPAVQRLTALALLFVMVFGLNFHLVFFQLYGWSGMLLENRESTQSWSAAAHQTISGDSPCNVCRQVEKAAFTGDVSLADRSSTVEGSFFSWLFVLVPASKPIMPSPPSAGECIRFLLTQLPSLTFTPDAPPPRVA